MKRIKISLSDETVNLLEEQASKEGMTKSTYLGMLVANQKNLRAHKYDKQILETISNIDVDLRALIIRPEIADNDKLKILEYAKEIKSLLKN